jgi:hypothetical protein
VLYSFESSQINVRTLDSKSVSAGEAIKAACKRLADRTRQNSGSAARNNRETVHMFDSEEDSGAPQSPVPSAAAATRPPTAPFSPLPPPVFQVTPSVRGGARPPSVAQPSIARSRAQVPGPASHASATSRHIAPGVGSNAIARPSPSSRHGPGGGPIAPVPQAAMNRGIPNLDTIPREGALGQANPFHAESGDELQDSHLNDDQRQHRMEDIDNESRLELRDSAWFLEDALHKLTNVLPDLSTVDAGDNTTNSIEKAYHTAIDNGEAHINEFVKKQKLLIRGSSGSPSSIERKVERLKEAAKKEFRNWCINRRRIREHQLHSAASQPPRSRAVSAPVASTHQTYLTVVQNYIAMHPHLAGRAIPTLSWIDASVLHRPVESQNDLSAAKSLGARIAIDMQAQFNEQGQGHTQHAFYGPSALPASNLQPSHYHAPQHPPSAGPPRFDTMDTFRPL